MNNRRRLVVLLVLIVCLSRSSHAQEQRWRAYGERVMLAAPASVRNGSTLDKARFVSAQIASYMAAQGIEPNSSLKGRLKGFWKYGYRRADRGSCGDVAAILGDAFAGAGIKADARGIVAEVGGTGRFNRAAVNRDHGAIAIVTGGRVYLFDPWMYASKTGTFAGFKATDRWNGMDYDTWVTEMRRLGYTKFGLYDDSPMQDWIDNETEKERRAPARKPRLSPTPPPARPTPSPRPPASPAADAADQAAVDRYIAAEEGRIPEMIAYDRAHGRPDSQYRLEWVVRPHLEGKYMVVASRLWQKCDANHEWTSISTFCSAESPARIPISTIQQKYPKR